MSYFKKIGSLFRAYLMATPPSRQETTTLILVFFIPLLFFIVLAPLKVFLNNRILFRKISPNTPHQEEAVKPLMYEGSRSGYAEWGLGQSLDPVSPRKSHLRKSVGTVLRRLLMTVGTSGQGCTGMPGRNMAGREVAFYFALAH